MDVLVKEIVFQIKNALFMEAHFLFKYNLITIYLDLLVVNPFYI